MGRFVGFLFDDPWERGLELGAWEGRRQRRYETHCLTKAFAIHEDTEEQEEEFREIRERETSGKDLAFRTGYDFGYRGVIF